MTINNADLKKIIFLKTAIIAKEWITSLYNDIFDGPKYLSPLIDSISFKLLICFFKDPEKLLHRAPLRQQKFLCLISI